MTLIPTPGTILSMTPAEGEVELVTDEASWRLPLIGYAVVVHYVGKVSTDTHDYETSITPVVLAADGTPDTMRSVVTDYDPQPKWAVITP